MSSSFEAEWVTIPGFAHSRPKCMYHKENEGINTSDGCCTESGGDSIRNLHVLARAELACGRTGIAEDTHRWILQMSADDYYKLYINGDYVGQGPAPAWPEDYYYNEIEITPYLHEGKNILAVHLYYQGLVNRVWNSGDGRFGMACLVLEEQLSEDTTRPVSLRRITPVWKYKISQAYSGEAIGYDTQFLENFDSQKCMENWKQPGFHDRNWHSMVRAEWADYQCKLQPTEMVSVSHSVPEKIRKTAYGLFVDVGQEITGSLIVQANAEYDGAKVVIRCGEELEKSDDVSDPEKDPCVRYDMRCNCRYEEIWTLKKGTCRLEPYDYKGFRYAELIFEEGVTITKVEAEVRHYPMDESLCTFSSNNICLNKIFDICKKGVKFGTQEGYLDCPTREKGQYLGDSVITARAQVWLTGDVRMLRKCIRQFALTREICPGIMAVAPGSYMQEIADFSLLWSQLLLTDYQFTGDQDFLRKYYPVARSILEYFRRYEREDGLLEQVKDKWNLVDWPENLRDGYEFELTRPIVGADCHNVINALYIGAVKVLEQIEEILKIRVSDQGAKGRQYGSAELSEAFIREFYSRETKLFRDSAKSSHSSIHSNIYPLYFGICPEGEQDHIADFLVKKGLCCGVMTGYFFLKALAAAGRYEDEYRILVNESEHGWVNMIREGATTCWEAWGKDQKWNTSLCHPWASGPISILIEDLAGFKPDPDAENGFRFEPHIPESMEKFSLKIPFRGKSYQYFKVSNLGDMSQKNSNSVLI